jgi:ATP-dependent protease ClpP protease subunit
LNPIALVALLTFISLSGFAKTINFKGVVTQSSVEKLVKQVNKAAGGGEQIEISFNSVGGDMQAAVYGYEELLKYNVNTYAAKECSSACTILFAAGVKRSAKSSADFMFHKVGVKITKGGSTSEKVKAYREHFAGIWLDVVRTVSPALSDELEKDETLIKGEKTYHKKVLRQYNYVNVD